MVAPAALSNRLALAVTTPVKSGLVAAALSPNRVLIAVTVPPPLKTPPPTPPAFGAFDWLAATVLLRRVRVFPGPSTQMPPPCARPLLPGPPKVLGGRVASWPGP